MSPYVGMANICFFFFCYTKILQKVTDGPTKVLFFFPYKQMGEMGIMNDLEWPMLLYYVIYYEKFRKIIQGTEKEALKCICCLLPHFEYVLTFSLRTFQLFQNVIWHQCILYPRNSSLIFYSITLNLFSITLAQINSATK